MIITVPQMADFSWFLAPAASVIAPILIYGTILQNYLRNHRDSATTLSLKRSSREAGKKANGDSTPPNANRDQEMAARDRRKVIYWLALNPSVQSRKYNKYLQN